MKIVVLDGYTENPGDLSWAPIEELGELTVYDRTAPEDIWERIKDAEAVYTNKTPLTKDTIDRCQNLKWIGVLATGYNVVDIKAAAKKGIYVCNIPTYGTPSVAQYTIALLLELCHHVGAHSESVKRGEWTNGQDWCYWNYPLVELAGKTLGIIGFGRIGRAVGRIAAAMGMNVLACTAPGEEGKSEDWFSYADMDEIFRSSHVISLHCPLFPETQGLINEETIGRMRDGVMIINDSRGGLIVEEDLRKALESGKVAGAAVDVVSQEPIKKDNPLLGAPNIIITPHIAWAPKEARERLMQIAAENLKAYQEGNPVNVVNGI